jgi:DNA invertase Pin-like site-specific DNA recombinase
MHPEIVETIGAAGARFRSLSEPWANITTHAGKMIMTVFAGVAEFERDLIREKKGQEGRTRKSETSAWDGPKKMNVEQRDLAQRLLKEGARGGPHLQCPSRNPLSHPRNFVLKLP